MNLATGQRRTVYYSGHVQGVGFRFTVRSIAANYAVRGYVRNLPDGRVELVAEGDSRQLEQFLTEVRSHFAMQIRDEKTDIQPPIGEFTGFEIRH